MRLSPASLAATVALLLGSASFAAAVPEPATPKMIHVVVQPEEDPAGEARHKRDLAAQEAMAFWAERMFQATLGQVLIGALSVVGLGFTLYYTRETAKAGRASAKAALDAVNDARERAKLELRAYVGIGQIVSSDPTIGDSVTIDIPVRNAGQTPARGVTTAFNHAFGSGEPSFGKPVPGKATELLPSGETSTTLMTRALDAQLLDDLQKKKRYIYCRGYISYRDTYGGRHEIETIFRSRYRPNGSLSFRVIRHNEASEPPPEGEPT